MIALCQMRASIYLIKPDFCKTFFTVEKHIFKRIIVAKRGSYEYINMIFFCAFNKRKMSRQ